MKRNKEERVDWSKVTDSKRLNELCEQYKPLVIKITNQQFKKLASGTSWNDIYSMANEGLALAIRNYNPSRSKMTFTQYAGFAILNNILNNLSSDLHVVSLNSYAVGKMKENGETTFTSVSMSVIAGEVNGEESYSREGKYGMYYEDRNAGEETPITKLIKYMQNNFKKDDFELFMRIYGLGNYEKCTAKEIAKERNITNGAISQRMKIMLNTIKSNTDIMESLITLL